MKKLGLTFGLLALLGGAAFAQSTQVTAPVLDLSDDEGSPSTFALTQQGESWLLGGTGTVTASDGTRVFNGTNGSILTFDPDPEINFGFGVFNGTSATETYTLSFPQTYGTSPLSVNLPAGNYHVSASLAVTVSESNGAGASFGQSGTPLILQGLLNQGDSDQVDVIDLGTGTLSLPPGGASTQSASETYPGLDFPNYFLASTGTSMSVTTTFTLSPNDSASFSGSYVINAVPEPASVLLGALALLVFAGFRARVRRA